MHTGPQGGISALRAKFAAEANQAGTEQKSRVYIPRAESVLATRAKFVSGAANNASVHHEQDAAFARSVAKLQELEVQRALTVAELDARRMSDDDAASIALAMQLQAEEDSAQVQGRSFRN